MSRRWREIETEKMLEYRDRGMTNAKIAERLSLIFMYRFTEESVKTKIRRLKESGYLEKNKRSGRFTNPLGIKREGENYAKTNIFQKRKHV